ncbi:hypothetical protein BG262_06435 [Floricoccus penangensis]|uniref:Polysaccharide polymerase n=1 Tax=Floricoccus penangensis TaxID=1859475 RepID=A0A9Q5JFF3_9LACT|nr:hypothetical protein [Floricoccus penangensis]OFI45908.1 hypothetical protein BG262_06435 [Floricoccus penangensis]
MNTEIKNRRYSSRYSKPVLLFMLAYFIAFSSDFISMTMFVQKLPGMFFKGMTLLSIAISIYKIYFFDTFKRKEIIIYFTILVILLADYFKYGGFVFLQLFILAIAARDIDRHTILKFSAVYLFISIFLIFCLSELGVVDNLLFIRYLNGRQIIRQSFGTIYPTVFGSMIYFFVLQFVYIKKNNSYSSVFFIAIVALVINKYTDNRLVFLLLIFLIAYIILNNIFNIEKNNSRVFTSIMKYTFLTFSIIIPIIFVYLCYNYNPSSRFYYELNKLLSNRVYLSWKGFQDYPITLFGQKVAQNGWGGLKEVSVGFVYFYLDSLPIKLLLSNGIFMFIIYIVYNFSYLKVLFRNKNIRLAVIIIFIIAYDIIDEKSIRVSLNPFLILSLGYIFDYQKIKNDSSDIKGFEDKKGIML